MSIIAYWSSNYLVDWLKYLIPGILCPIVSNALGASMLTNGNKYNALWELFIFYGLAIIPTTYLMAYIFKEHTKAQTATFFINFGVGFIGSLAISIL